MNRVTEMMRVGRFLDDSAWACVDAIPARKTDRLYYEIEARYASVPVLMVGTGSGKTHAVALIVYQLLYEDVQHFFDGQHRLYAACHGENPYMLHRRATVGHLLDAERPLWACLHSLAKPLELLQRATAVALISSRANIWQQSDSLQWWNYAFVTSVNMPRFQELQLSDILARLEDIENPLVLERWFASLLKSRAKLPQGVLADSAALAIARRLLEVDFERAFFCLRPVLRPQKSMPFRFGFFQLSLVGALAARFPKASTSRILADALWAEVQSIRAQFRGAAAADVSVLSALLGALTAVALLAEESSVADLKRIDDCIASALADFADDDQKHRYLRILGDTLNQGITTGNLQAHFTKLMAFVKHAKTAPSLLRPQNRLLRLIGDVIEPAKQLLAS